jgi:hypothetical protein
LMYGHMNTTNGATNGTIVYTLITRNTMLEQQATT